MTDYKNKNELDKIQQQELVQFDSVIKSFSKKVDSKKSLLSNSLFFAIKNRRTIAAVGALTLAALLTFKVVRAWRAKESPRAKL